jgi:DNA-binding transcriptional MerR regulator
MFTEQFLSECKGTNNTPDQGILDLLQIIDNLVQKGISIDQISMALDYCHKMRLAETTKISTK